MTIKEEYFQSRPTLQDKNMVCECGRIRQMSTGMVLVALLHACCPSTTLQKQNSSRPSVITEQEISKSWKQATQFAKSGKYRSALEKYMFILENGRRIPSYFGVRLSFLLGYIINIGRMYPDALLALRNYRNHCEKEVHDGKGGTDPIDEIIEINIWLGEDDRTINFFISLQSKNNKHMSMLDYYIERMLYVYMQRDRMQKYFPMQKRQYKIVLLSEIAPQVAKSAMRMISKATMNKEKNRKEKEIINRVVLIYEYLLAIDNRKLAEEVKIGLIKYRKKETIYRLLIDATSSVHKYDIRRELIKEAEKEMPGIEFDTKAGTSPKLSEPGDEPR